MKKLILAGFILASTLSSLPTLAQDNPNPKPKREKIESMKIGFLTERLDLTPTEAKNFWPVYNQYQGEMENLHKSRRDNMIDARKNFDEMSDADIEKLIDSEVGSRQQELDIVKKYIPQFKKVLPVRKVALLYRSEEEFKRKLLEMLQEKRDGKRMEERRMERQEMR